ncbi:hypothetical protein BYT27DRAFT_7263147 [Phlegmacium glaucopus]|nr:hypothetical protein BYT27DRAFT_7263147 [Phlegmacium glaucopus]
MFCYCIKCQPPKIQISRTIKRHLDDDIKHLEAGNYSEIYTTMLQNGIQKTKESLANSVSVPDGARSDIGSVTACSSSLSVIDNNDDQSNSIIDENVSPPNASDSEEGISPASDMKDTSDDNEEDSDEDSDDDEEEEEEPASDMKDTSDDDDEDSDEDSGDDKEEEEEEDIYSTGNMVTFC